MKQRNAPRGAAIAEVAVVISFTLLMLFGMLQVILIGYLQVAGDSAVFIAAHEYTLGVTQATITTAESAMVPSILTGAVTYNPATPNPIATGVFNQVYGNINAADRNGGYTLVRPQNFQVSLSNTGGNASTFNAVKGVEGFKNLPISSGAVEGYYLMANTVMNNAGVGPNDPGADGNAVLNPQQASPFEPASDHASTNMNVPPYYAPTAYMEFCADPWATQNNGGTTSARSNFSDTCVDPVGESLGMAEYLDDNNYSAANMGVGLNSVFQAMASHQRIYADLIPAFPPIGPAGALTPLAVQDQYLADIQSQFQNTNGSGGNDPNTDPLNPALGTSCSRAGPCGALWTPNATIFPNNGVQAPVPLYNYDPMNWWGLSRYASGQRPNWMGRGVSNSLWNTETSANGAVLGDDPGLDGAFGPAGWNGASPALVYEWDSPNGNNSQVLGPGHAPLHPLAGTGTAGDPGY